MDKTVYGLFHSICSAEICCENVTFSNGTSEKDEAGPRNAGRLNPLLTLRNSLRLRNPGKRRQKAGSLGLKFGKLIALSLDDLRFGVLNELLIAKL